MMDVFNAIFLRLPVKLAGDLVAIVEAAPVVEIVTYIVCMAMAVILLWALSGIFVIKAR